MLTSQTGGEWENHQALWCSTTLIGCTRIKQIERIDGWNPANQFIGIVYPTICICLYVPACVTFVRQYAWPRTSTTTQPASETWTKFETKRVLEASLMVHQISRWFQRLLNCTLTLREMIQLDKHIFETGGSTTNLFSAEAWLVN